MSLLLCCVQALSNLVWACAKVEHWDERLFDLFASRLVAHKEDLCPLDLGNYAWGLGKAYSELASRACRPTDDVFEKAYHRYLTEKPIRMQVGTPFASGMNRTSGSKHLSSFSSLEHRPTSRPMQVCPLHNCMHTGERSRSLLSRRIDQWLVQQALQTISAVARRQIDALDIRAVSNILFGFACVHFWDGALMDLMAERTLTMLDQCIGQARLSPPQPAPRNEPRPFHNIFVIKQSERRCLRRLCVLRGSLRP
jgi:hypothetical protein